MEDRRFDILIIGSGASGMMAGLAAAQTGKKCLMLERGKHIAVSNAARAGGPALANTELQHLEGEVVSVEKLFTHMYQFSRGTVNAGLLRRAVSKGRCVEHFFNKCHLEMSLIPDSYGVGFRARQVFNCSGKKRWQPLAEEFIKSGGQIHFSQQVIDIISDDENTINVHAINPEYAEEKYSYEAKAVIIATGGFLGNKAMIEEHFGAIHVLPLGSRLCDGTGIRLALAAGGIKDRNWGICANEFSGANDKLSHGAGQFTPETRYATCGGLLINRQGRRFMNEQYLSDWPLSVGGEVVLREGVFYAVLDSEMYEMLGKTRAFEYYGSPAAWHAGRMNQDPLRERKEGGLKAAIKNGWAFTGTLDEISEAASLPELKNTVIKYNQLCDKKNDYLFGKADYLLKAIKKEPYYVFEYEPSAWCTFGGVKTDEFCRLLNARGQVIKGIYVAGVDNGSCYCVPYYDNEGAALGLALTTGIIAGEHAAGLEERDDW